jgi:Zn-dependent protease
MVTMLVGGRSIPLVRLFGIPVGVAPSWFLVLFVVIYVLADWFTELLGDPMQGFLVAVASALLLFCSLILHELGHALVARRQGIEIAGIDLWLLGGIAKMRSDTTSPGREFAVAAAGPAVSLLLAIVFLLLSALVLGPDDASDLLRFRTDVEVTALLLLLVTAAQWNAYLFVFNLIPAFPLDGGRIARAIVWRLTGERSRATRLTARVGQLAGYAAVAGGLYLALVGDDLFDGIWIAVLGWFVATAAGSAVSTTAFTEQLEGITVADVMDPSPVAVPAALPAGRAAEEFFLRYRWEWFPVVDEAGRFLGVAHHHRVACAPPGAAVGDAVDDDAEDWRVGADQPLEALLGSERLRRRGALMAVDREGVLRGVVTAEQVARAVQAVLPAR